MNSSHQLLVHSAILLHYIHRRSRRSGRSGKCRTKYFSSSTRYYKNIIYLALSAAIIAKYSYITFQSTRELWHRSIQHHVVYAMVVITWLPRFSLCTLTMAEPEIPNPDDARIANDIEVPHQPRKYHFPERSFGNKGEKRSFKVAWFDTWWWLSYQDIKYIASWSSF